jgi:translation initiation factor 1
MSDSKLVYSSSQGSLRKEPNKSRSYQASSGPTKMRLETKGRGGRSVTVLWNFPWDDATVKSLMKDIQQKQACGATFKDGRIEFQGDIRTKVQEHFQEKGWKLVAAGG